MKRERGYLVDLVHLAWTQLQPSDSELPATWRGLCPGRLHVPELAPWLRGERKEPAQGLPASAAKGENRNFRPKVLCFFSSLYQHLQHRPAWTKLDEFQCLNAVTVPAGCDLGEGQMKDGFWGQGLQVVLSGQSQGLQDERKSCGEARWLPVMLSHGQHCPSVSQNSMQIKLKKKEKQRHVSELTKASWFSCSSPQFL